MSVSVLLFTRDLRVAHNPALSAAAREGEVLPLFVLDRAILDGSAASPNRLAFLLQSLHDLDESLRRLGARLIVRSGDAVREAVALAREHRAEAVHISHDVTPFARRRAERLVSACDSERLRLVEHPGITVVQPGALTPAGGDHYAVFTPYWRVWSAADPAPTPPAPRSVRMPGKVRAGRLPSARQLAAGTPSALLPAGGEREGRDALRRFERSALSEYGQARDDLARANTSGLSPYLHFGCLAPAAVLSRARAAGAGGSEFARQLCWRDFHHQVLAARPELPRRDYRARGDRWHEDGQEEEAWREGMTGVPIVDAGMRQLAREGFLHNRARLIVGSFLSKTLYIDWRVGAAHFASLLVDADVANNVGNWQWVAGTGNDTRPNRVLNPLRQAARFDPDGEYVRRYVPELDGLEGAAAHEPWRLPAARRRALSYPEPIIDLDAAAARLRAVRGS